MKYLHIRIYEEVNEEDARLMRPEYKIRLQRLHTLKQAHRLINLNFQGFELEKIILMLSMMLMSLQ